MTQHRIKQFATWALLLFYCSSALAFEPRTGQVVQLDDRYNGRSEPRFEGSSNILFTIPVGTRAKILDVATESRHIHSLQIEIEELDASGKDSPYGKRVAWVRYDARKKDFILYRDSPKQPTREVSNAKGVQTNAPVSASAPGTSDPLHQAVQGASRVTQVATNAGKPAQSPECALDTVISGPRALSEEPDQSPCTIKSYLKKAAQKYGIPERVFYAVAWTESYPKWKHWKKSDGKWVPVAGGNDKEDWGLMQINRKVHQKATDWNRVVNDPAFNADYGASVVKWAMKEVKKRRPQRQNVDFYKAVYAVYNGGTGVIDRPWEQHDHRDRNFSLNYRTQPWLKLIKDCP